MASKQPLFPLPLLGLLLAIGGIAAGCQSRPGPDLLLLQRRQEQLELKLQQKLKLKRKLMMKLKLELQLKLTLKLKLEEVEVEVRGRRSLGDLQDLPTPERQKTRNL